MKTLYSWRETTEEGQYSLFPSEELNPLDILSQTENINQYCFYGRCIGFQVISHFNLHTRKIFQESNGTNYLKITLQFCEGMRTILKFVSVGMASFSELYYANGTVFGRCSNSLQYLMDPEAKARRIVTISQHADISFCQAFWHLNESGKYLSHYNQINQIMNPY